MKLATMLLMVMALQFSIFMFSEGTLLQNPSTSITVIGQNVSAPNLLGLMLEPTNWANSFVLLLIVGITAAAAVAGSYVGSFFMGKQDIVIFGTFAAVCVSWAIPLVSFWQMIFKESLFGTATIQVAGLTIENGANAVFASIFTTPLLILALISVLSWWRTTAEG